jgi:hypothetical protein
MSKERASLVFSGMGTERTKLTALELYLNQRRDAFARTAGLAAAENQITQFGDDLQRVFSKIQKQRTTPLSEASLLAFGKVQSGKTAHMLGLLSWVADNGYGVAVVLTGVTKALHGQGRDRFEKELGENGTARAKILDVPTSPRGPQYRDLVDTIAQLMLRRANQTQSFMANSPLPILMTLKNRARIETTRSCIADALKKSGVQAPVFIIDDEADQASPNSRVRLAEASKTYAAIAKLRETFKANVLVSYTATPQAVLLAPTSSALRPRECVMIRPGAGYFGIQELVDSQFENNRLSIHDWPKREIPNMPPESLVAALRDYFLVAWIRQAHPKAFYSRAPAFADKKLSEQSNSVQMLIHQSMKTSDHGAVKQLVVQAKDRIQEEVKSIIAGSSVGKFADPSLSKWVTQLEQIIHRISVPGLRITTGEFEKDAGIIHELIDYCNVIVVDSDKAIAEKIPDSEEKWNLKKCWVVIGGEILGRGLTFPQLISTYFLRASKAPNVDTVSQQMRFCGYRSWYKPVTTIWAPDEIHESFRVLEGIERIVWSRATEWDFKGTDLIAEPPSVAFVAPGDSPFNPTRKVVWDPKLISSTEKGAVIDELDYSPRRFGSKLQAVDSFRRETKTRPRSMDSWDVYEDLNARELQKLLVNWTDNSKSYLKFRRVASLFQSDLAELGLAHMPLTVLIHHSLVGRSFEDLSAGSWWKLAVSNGNARTVRGVQAVAASPFTLWESIARSPQTPVQYREPQRSSPYLGDRERELLARITNNSTKCLIEPVFGVNRARSKDWKDVVALSIGLTVVVPPTYSVRVIGLEGS